MIKILHKQFTNDELLAAYSTPYNILPAAASGKINVVFGATAKFTPGAEQTGFAGSNQISLSTAENTDNGQWTLADIPYNDSAVWNTIINPQSQPILMPFDFLFTNGATWEGGAGTLLDIWLCYEEKDIDEDES